MHFSASATPIMDGWRWKSFLSAFVTHLLELVDVFSDIVFSVTVFVLWDTKEGESPTSLLAIGNFSIAAVVVAQVYMVIITY